MNKKLIGALIAILLIILGVVFWIEGPLGSDNG